MGTFIPGAIYILGVVTCLICTLLLARGYLRTRVRLLMWCCIFFAAITVDNFILFFDLIVYPQVDLALWRNSATLFGLASMIFGLVWEGE